MIPTFLKLTTGFRLLLTTAARLILDYEVSPVSGTVYGAKSSGTVKTVSLSSAVTGPKSTGAVTMEN